MEQSKLSFHNIFKSKSIASNLMQWYLFLLIISVSGVIYLYQLSTQTKQTSKELLENHQAISNYALKLESELNYWSFLQYNFLFLKQEPLKLRAEGVWDKRVLPYIDSIKVLTHNQENPALIEKSNNLRINVLRLKEPLREIQKIIADSLKKSPQNLAQKEQNFDLLLNKIRKDLLSLSANEETIVKFSSFKIQENIENLFLYATALIAFIIFLGLFLVIWFVRKVLSFNKRVIKHTDDLIHGNIPVSISTKVTEIEPLANIANELTDSYLRVKRLAEEVGMSKFDTEVRPFFGKGVLGASINKMRESLKQIANQNEERNWFNEGFAKFAEILRTTSRDSELFYDSVISNLVKYLGVSQGGIFSVHENIGGQNEYMELKASYAFNRKKYLQKEITKEDGLVGQVWREKEIIHITDIPEDYSEITSGLGYAKPRSILVAPLIVNDEVAGALELASFDVFLPRQIEFIKRMSESIASTMLRLKGDTETKHLLSESQEMAEKMKSQEEEMRQSMEQLIVTQEKIEQNVRELELQLQTINQIFIKIEINPEGFITQVNEQALKIYGYIEKELINKHFTILLGELSNNESVERDWRRAINGAVIQGEFVRYNKFSQKLWLNEVIYPVYDVRNKVVKIYMLGYDITKQKEQESNLKLQINDLQMSKRDVVNRIREIENKSKQKIQQIQQEYIEMLREKDRMIDSLQHS